MSLVLRVRDLISRIQRVHPNFTGNRLTKTQLLRYARGLDVITDAELIASTEPNFLTRKCYLRTLIGSPYMLQKIESYVQCYSMLFVRAHQIANLAFHLHADVPLARPQELIRDRLFWSPRTTGDNTEPLRPSTELYHLCFETNYPELIQEMFYPEVRPGNRPMYPIIANVMNLYSHILQHLLPANCIQTMCATGWYRTKRYVAEKMRSTMDLYVRKSVVRHVKSYVRNLQDDIDPDVLVSLVSRPWHPPPDEVHPFVVKIIRDLRETFGMTDESYLPDQALNMTEHVLDLHLHFARIGILKRKLMPCGNLDRKYAVIDTDIAWFLFSEARGPFTARMAFLRESRFLDSIGFSPDQYDRAYRSKRYHLSRRPGNRKKDRRIRKKWRKRGRKRTVPQGARCATVNTDGTGLSLCISYIPRLLPIYDEPVPNRKKRKLIEKVEEREITQMRVDDGGTRPVFVGIDGGRAKILCSAIDYGDGHLPTTKTFTRHQYYYSMGHRRRQSQIRQRVGDNPALQHAIEALGIAGQSHNILAYITTQNLHSEVLLDEYVRSTFYSLQKMRAFRLKKSSLDRAANGLIDSARKAGRRLVVGFGNAQFGWTGRREKSVPVKGIVKALLAAKKRKENERLKSREMIIEGAGISSFSSPISFFEIDEFRTTVTCCACGSATSAPRVTKPNGRRWPSSRLRFCMPCCSLKDRDVQAARNILRLTRCLYYGLERPMPFRRH